MIKKTLNILLYFSFLALIHSCGSKTEESKKKKTANRTLYTIQDSDSEASIKLLGSVSHRNKAEVSSKVIGRVEKIFKDQGQKVQKGEPLAKIETLNLELQLRKDEASVEVQNKQIDLSRAKYIQARQRIEKELANIEKAKAEEEEAKANLENLQRTLNNKKDLFEIGGVSETELKGIETAVISAETTYFKAKKNYLSIQVGYRIEDLKKNGIPIPQEPKQLAEAFVNYNTIVEKAELDMAIANMKATLASIESTKLLIKESTLVSPLSGKVAVRSLYVGESTKEGSPVFIIVDDSEIYITFPVSESDLPLFQEGKYINFTIDALNDNTPKKGKIEIVSPIIDAQSRTAEVKVAYSNDNKKIKPGMFARGILNYRLSNDSISIPSTGILLSPDKKTGKIFKSSGNNLCFSNEVEVISIENERILIKGSVEIGEQIVLGNLNSLSDGQAWNE
ncbi:efflux RND transporter periplasmic adaptor subunit [Leptospira jelokensis]|uniref:efflux RND transporter periplasmic adaptor subunit n=1 Tax=Leptospira jelokensis TaxID=2484931 RepID=UPI001090FBE9|nr:efflux RND transporter periplasmic adaptor subunit [Leptospira jelokensis]TGM06663.1 efflux RND transporter periplasmic adaptor subunit [Leptospira jelokensis]